MDLSKKKRLAKRTLNVGEDRIVFLESRLEEIKDANNDKQKPSAFKKARKEILKAFCYREKPGGKRGNT